MPAEIAVFVFILTAQYQEYVQDMMDEIDNKNEDNKELEQTISKFPPKLRQILNYRYKNSEGLSIAELCRLNGLNYKSIMQMIFKQKKKDNNFYELLHQIERELVLNRKIQLDNKFYKMVCESDDLEAVRKSIKTFYETQKLIQPDNKPIIQTVVAINIPISLKDMKPLDLDN